MKQINLMLFLFAVSSFCVIPVTQAITMQNLKQKAAGVGMTVLALGAAAITLNRAYAAGKLYDKALRTNIEADKARLINYKYLEQACSRNRNRQIIMGTVNLALSGAAGYCMCKAKQKALQYFKNKQQEPIQQQIVNS